MTTYLADSKVRSREEISAEARLMILAEVVRAIVLRDSLRSLRYKRPMVDFLITSMNLRAPKADWNLK